jgi:hypothetical protein
MTSVRRDLEKRAQEAILRAIITDYKKQRSDWLSEPPVRKAVLAYSFFQTANALLIAAIILITGFVALLLLFTMGPVGLIFATVAGLIALVLFELFFLYRSFRNEDVHARAVSDMFESKVDFDLARIKNNELRAKVDKSLEYWSLINETIAKVPDSPIRDSLMNTTREVTHWLQAVFNLADRVDKFRLNEVISRDLEYVPLAIKEYKKKLSQEDNPEVRRQLEKTIADKERQLKTLQSLEDNMEAADYQLESTISSLGTIYSQLLLVGSKDESGSKIARLQEEVSEQVHRLEDIAQAMDDVYQRSY